jgi:DNA-binding transcriptional ArsR family regulator
VKERKREMSIEKLVTAIAMMQRHQGWRRGGNTNLTVPSARVLTSLISIVAMTVEVESEDVKVLVTFSTDDLSFPEVDELNRRIMELLARGVRTLGLLSEELGISKPTVWRRLRRLERAGMVMFSKGRRREIAVDLTERGLIYWEILTGRRLN